MAAKRASAEVETVEETVVNEEVEQAEETEVAEETEAEEVDVEETEEEQEEKPVTYQVAAGKSLMTKAGVKAAGAKVEAKHFHKGEEHLAELLEKGFLEKV